MQLPAGYSDKSLAAKLGIRSPMHVTLIDPPAHYLDLLGPLPDGIIFESGLPTQRPEFVHQFASNRSDLERTIPSIVDLLLPRGIWWISWPKKTSGVVTDLTEDVLRELLLPQGLVDTKVCAVDDTWSGLKFVHRRIP